MPIDPTDLAKASAPWAAWTQSGAWPRRHTQGRADPLAHQDLGELLPVRLQLDVPDGGRQPLAERHRTRPLGQALLPVLDRLGVWSDALAQRSCPSASTSISQVLSAANSCLAESAICCRGGVGRWGDRHPGHLRRQAAGLGPKRGRGSAGLCRAGGQPAQRRRHRRGQGAAGRPAAGRPGASLADRAGQGGADGRERLDAQTAFERLRGAARSSTRRLADVARDVTVGQPLPTNRRELARAVPSQAKDRQTGT
jgi:hypothetical protein